MVLHWLDLFLEFMTNLSWCVDNSIAIDLLGILELLSVAIELINFLNALTFFSKLLELFLLFSITDFLHAFHEQACPEHAFWVVNSLLVLSKEVYHLFNFKWTLIFVLTFNLVYFFRKRLFFGHWVFRFYFFCKE